MPGTLAYIHAFPNLEYLSLTSPNNRFDDPAVDELEDPLSTRPLIVDIRRQTETIRLTTDAPGTACAKFLEALSILPKVRILDTITEWTCTLLPDVLADVRPSCLVITFAGMSMFGTGGSLYWMLREREAHLRALELEVRCSANEGAWSLGGIVDVICGTLNRTPLQSLALTLNCVALTRQSPCRRPRIGGVPNDEESCTLVRELESADLHLYHQRFREALPSLKDISVRLSVESLALDDEDDCASILSSESSVGEMDPDLATFMIEEDDEGW